MQDLADAYLSIVANMPFSDAVAKIKSRMTTDEEVLESQGYKEFICKLARLSAQHQTDVGESARLVAVAMYAAGYELDLYHFGLIIGSLMIYDECRPVSIQEFEDSIKKVLPYYDEEKSKEPSYVRGPI